MNDEQPVEAPPRTDPDPLLDTALDADRSSSVSGIYHRPAQGGDVEEADLSARAMEALDEDLEDLPDELEEHLFKVAEAVREHNASAIPSETETSQVAVRSAVEIYRGSSPAICHYFFRLTSSRSGSADPIGPSLVKITSLETGGPRRRDDRRDA